MVVDPAASLPRNPNDLEPEGSQPPRNRPFAAAELIGPQRPAGGNRKAVSCSDNRLGVVSAPVVNQEVALRGSVAVLRKEGVWANTVVFGYRTVHADRRKLW